MIVGISVGAVLLIGGGVFIGVKTYNESKAKENALVAAQQQKDEEQKRLQKQLEEQNAKVERLLADLTSAKDDAQKAAIQKQIEDAQEAQKKLKGSVGGGKPSTGSGGPAKACNCQPGDPLCSCL